MRFAPHTDEDVRAMLAVIGSERIDDLFSQIPPAVRLDRSLELAPGISEQELVAHLADLARRNLSTDDLICFAGAGAYDHYVPSVVWALAGRSEFATSYTPYQPELSQGTLQALFEFQSMVCELTDMEVANASLYDGATALVEAVHMCRVGSRSRVLVAGGVDLRFVDALRTYGRGAGYEPEVLPAPGGTGGIPEVGDDVACLVVQHPNAHGILEDVAGFVEAGRAGGAKTIQIFDPMTLGVLRPPGELGVDVAVAEGQPLGNHLNFGGPGLGLLAARMHDVRRMPGRIVGETLDVDGRIGYVLTLQAREQHIRRERATSNICTNQTLMALAATVFMAWLGPQGLREVGEASAAKASYAFARLSTLSGVEPLYPNAPFLREFALRLPMPAVTVRDALIARGYLAGVPVRGRDDALLLAFTERRTRQEIDGLVEAMGEVLSS